MRILVLIWMALGLSLSGEAVASCAAEYSAGALGSDITALHKALRANDTQTLSSAGARLAEGLPCTSVVPPVGALASAYRFIGIHHAIAGKADDARSFFRSAIELDPNFEWGVSELENFQKICSIYDSERQGALVDATVIEGKAFVVAAGSSVYIDGREAKKVAATEGRPHLVQVVAGGQATQTHLVIGTAFPETLVGEEAKATSNNYGAIGPVRVSRNRPPAKTPLLIVGGVGLAVSGGLYGASLATRSSFDSATTTEELMKHKSMTNTLVIGSAAALLVGVGSGYAGIALDGRPGLVYHLRY